MREVLAPPVSMGEAAAFLASSGVWRFRVGRSGSLSEGSGLLAAVDEESVVVVFEVRRCMVGRSGSSAGVDPVVPLDVDDVVDAVVDVSGLEEVLGVRRCMVGRSGSSAGVVPVVPLDVDDVVELVG